MQESEKQEAVARQSTASSGQGAGTKLRHRISINNYLSALVFFSVAPLLGFLTYTVNALSTAERRNAEYHAVELSRSIVNTVDLELVTLESTQPLGQKSGTVVPVPKGGRMRASAARSPSQSLSKRLSGIRIPSHWRALVLDPNGVRLWSNEAGLTGAPVPAGFMKNLKQAENGRVEHRFADGLEGVSFIRSTNKANWTVVVGVPREELDAPFRRSMILLATIAAAVLGLGLIASSRISGRVRSIVQAVEAQAVRLGRGEPPNLVETEIRELQSLATAIHEAGGQRSLAEESLRESEAGLKQAQAIACLGSWRFDRAGSRLTWSDELFRIMGLQPQQFEPTYGAFLSRVHPDDRAKAETALSDSIRNGLGGYEVEHRIVRTDGQVRFVQEKCEHLRGATGRLLRSVGTLRDITERIESDAALQAARIEAEHANSAKSRFLAAASHDLRQPLSALALYVGVLNKRVALEDRPLLHHMKDCVRSLSDLLTDLLDLSKLDAGAVTPNVSDFAIAEMISNLVSVHGPEAQLKNLDLRCASSSLVARTDAVLFRRMLGNLLSNALRYTERGSVLIGCRRRHGKLWVEVWDTGIGFPTDKTAQIFEEFKQLGDENRQRGSGLGLAIVAKSATLLGLQIRVRSRPGRGSMFAVEMPPGRKAEKRTARRLAPLPMRIALVEDNTDVRRALSHALRAAGHEVVAAATGEELHASLGGRAPELVISDYRLAKGETGFEVITSVRAAFGRAVPAVLVTGDTDPELTRSMAARGIVVRHKPLEIDASQNWIAEVMEQEGAAAHKRVLHHKNWETARVPYHKNDRPHRYGAAE
jgi:PAS domain S-box-containing protein